MKLLSVIFLACVALVFCDDSTLSSSRIVGGAPANIANFMFMTQLRRDHFGTGSWHQQCGGVLIHGRLVLTSAHCFHGVQDPIRWRVRAGTASRLEGGVERLVLDIIEHPSYNNISLENNLAIVRLLSILPIAATQNINAANLAPFTTSPPAAGQNVNVLGWGATVLDGAPSTLLQQVTVPVIFQGNCAVSYASVHLFVGTKNICVGNTAGICTRDEGGPLMVGNMVHGIASFVFGCGQTAFPSVYTHISPFRAWIDEYVQSAQND